MSEEMKKAIRSLSETVEKLDEGQQAALSLIAHGMELQKELSEKVEEEPAAV